MTTKSLNRMNNTRQWFPRYLLSNQMIVTRDQVGSPALSDHGPSISQQSLDGNSNILKAVHTLIVIVSARNQTSNSSRGTFIKWLKKSSDSIYSFCWVWESPILEWKWCRPSPRIMPLASWPLGIGCGHFGIKLFNEMHPMPRKLWDCQGVFWPVCPISLPPMPLSADPSWEITPNPNFLRRPPVCYSCPENPSLVLQHKHTYGE